MLSSNSGGEAIAMLSKMSNEPEWMVSKRKSSFAIFNESTMPSFVYGLNIKLNIDLDLHSLKLNDNNIDIASKKTITINSSQKIKSAVKIQSNEDWEYINGYFMSQSVPVHDIFTAFHGSFLGNIALIVIPKDTHIKEPIEITTEILEKISAEHLIVVVEENAHATIVEKLESKEIQYHSRVVEIFLKDNATLNYGMVQQMHTDAFLHMIKRAILGKNAVMNWLDCSFGSRIMMNEVTSYLNGEHSCSDNYGIFFAGKNQQYDIVANSIHNAAHTKSDIFTKGALKNNAKCIYRGLVRIEQNAPGSNGYQKEDTLLLDQEAAADSIPNLEIENSDVRCTHGATIGRIDKEKLFYMQSRGLDKNAATREYVKGFFEPLILKMRIHKLQESMHEMVAERMGS